MNRMGVDGAAGQSPEASGKGAGRGGVEAERGLSFDHRIKVAAERPFRRQNPAMES